MGFKGEKCKVVNSLFSFAKTIILSILGSSDQVRYLVSQGCIPPMCDLLTVMDAKIVQVALSGLENILRFGEQEPKDTNTNYYANLVEECYGLDKIEFLQSHENLDIYRKVIPQNSNMFSQILNCQSIC